MSRRHHFAADDDRGGPPQPGLYTVRLVRGGPFVAAEIIDDAGFWFARINGEPDGTPRQDPYAHPGIMRIWHYGRRSDATEHALIEATKVWAVRHQPNHPLLHPSDPIELGALPAVIP